MESPTQWTWIWVNSGSWWWWTRRPGMQQSMGLQRVRHDWVTELALEKTSYINTYIWSLEKWSWWTHLQHSSGDTDIENRLVDAVREERMAMNGGSRMERYIAIRKTDCQWEFALWFREFKPVLCDPLEGWEGVGGGRKFQKGGVVWISVADSYWCMAETNTVLISSYLPVREKKKKTLASALLLIWWEPHGHLVPLTAFSLRQC